MNSTQEEYLKDIVQYKLIELINQKTAIQNKIDILYEIRKSMG